MTDIEKGDWLLVSKDKDLSPAISDIFIVSKIESDGTYALVSLAYGNTWNGTVKCELNKPLSFQLLTTASSKEVFIRKINKSVTNETIETLKKIIKSNPEQSIDSSCSFLVKRRVNKKK